MLPVGELVRSHAYVIKLLTDGEGNSFAVVEGTTPGRQYNPFSSLPLRLLGPALTLKELKLRRARNDSQNAESERDLNHRDACLWARHQGSISPGAKGAGKSTNSE